MPGFLYFLPIGDTRGVAPTPEQRAAAGVSYAFEGSPLFRGLTRGPDGKAGALLGCRRRWELGNIYYEAGSQHWQRHYTGKYYVGRFTTLPMPTPSDLEREHLIDGHKVELGEHRWIVPVARRHTDLSDRETFRAEYQELLPQGLAQNAAGQWIEQGPLPKYRRLWELAAAWNDVRRGGLSEEVAKEWNGRVINAAIGVLAENYVLGELECSSHFLNLITFDGALQVLDHLIDEPTLELFKKKWLAAANAPPAGSTSSPGPAADSAVTPPASPT